MASGYTGSSASSIRSVLSGREVRATSTACSASGRGRVGGEVDARGEPPGAVVHDPHREAGVLGVPGALELVVAHPELQLP